jgi:hypothetical protein
MPKSSLTSKTGNASVKRTGHTSQNKFGQGAASGVKEKGVKSGSGTQHDPS